MIVLSTNEEYLDSLLRGFENDIVKETEESEESVSEEVESEEVESEEVFLEEGLDVDFPEPQPDVIFPEEFLDELNFQESDKVDEEDSEVSLETDIESNMEEYISDFTLETDIKEYVPEFTLEDVLQMEVDEEAFFADEIKNYDELDPRFLDSMKQEWDSGLNVEDFGFSDEDFQFSDEDLKFDFSELDAAIDATLADTGLLPEIEDGLEDLFPMDIPEMHVEEKEAPVAEHPENESFEASEMPEMNSLFDSEELFRTEEPIESLPEQEQKESEESSEIDDLFHLLGGADSTETSATAGDNSGSDLNIDFTNMFDDGPADIDELGLEYSEEESDGISDCESDAEDFTGTSFLQKLLAEKEDPPEVEEQLQKEAEEKAEKKAAKKAEQSEKNALKKQQRAEKAQAKKEAKERKKAEEAANPLEPFSKKGIMFIALFGITFGVIVLLFSSLLSYQPYISNARKYFDAREYEKAYEALQGIEVKERDEEFYAQVRTMAKLMNKFSAYEQKKAIGQTAEALSSLVEGVAYYDGKIEYAKSIGLEKEYGLVLSEMEKILEGEFDLTLGQVRGMTSEIGTRDYSVWIQEQVK